MFKKSYLFSFILFCSSLAADLSRSEEEEILAPKENEAEIIEHLIQSTQSKLEEQKELKTLILLFREQEERFFKGDQSKEHTTKMVGCARQILEMIRSSHIEHLFSSEFMEELALFSSIAGKASAQAR
jgi:hypothetical protein